MKNPKKPLVSIIINCYNGEKFLKDCLDSILKQDYFNWEIIFWDNVSKDKSKNIYNSYTDKRFKYFLAKKHTNLYQARNLAIKKARGDIITFIDVDDLWLEDKLSKQVKFFKENKSVNFVYGNLFRVKKFFIFSFKSKIFKSKLPSGFICNDILKLYSVGWPSVAIKKDVFKNKVKPFDEKLDMLSDYDFVIKYSMKKKIGVLQEPLAIYREHSNQLSRKNFFFQAEQFLRWFHDIKKLNKIRKYKNFFKLREKYELFNAILKINSEISFFKKIHYVKEAKFKKNKAKAFLFLILDKFYIKYLLSTS